MTTACHLELMLLPHRYAIFRLPPHEQPAFVWPKFTDGAGFVSLTHTQEELPEFARSRACRPPSPRSAGGDCFE
jgi:hypothetical protein